MGKVPLCETLYAVNRPTTSNSNMQYACDKKADAMLKRELRWYSYS